MKAKEYLGEGKVREALVAVQEEVRTNPQDVSLRALLFQVLSLLGQWQRALTQLRLVGELDAQTGMTARILEPVLQAELHRQEIMAGRASPVIFGEPAPWMASLIEGNQLAIRGDFAGARKILQEAVDAAPPASGNINGSPFECLLDPDLRFGPFLEAVIDGTYFWLPFFRLRTVRTQPPKHFHDLVWLPAGFVWSNGGEGAGFIFTRYPSGEDCEDGELCLARRTEWAEKMDGFSVGRGQRLLATEAQDFPILEIRSIDFKSN